MGATRGVDREDRYVLLSRVLGALAFVALLAGLYAALVYAPREATMGDVQRIFYFHVASAAAAFLAFFVVFVASVAYLVRRDRQLDNVAAASAEVGVVFCTLVLVTGPLWAKPAWGTWWTWDPRLTTTLVLWLIYVAYLMLRGAIEEPARRAAIAAVFGIAGFVDVPIVFMSIRWWRTIHPVIVEGGELQLSPEMVVALVVSLIAFTLLYAYLLLQRVRLQRSEDELAELEADLSYRADLT
ncbi:MAG: cytochrome c biogenesis protein CcsA [Dehalococcoidales bacterium]|nr:cytochrome c biogenesis protein CcsA [Dehalococcoidales bacterium]